jgi:hypothetical protein
MNEDFTRVESPILSAMKIAGEAVVLLAFLFTLFVWLV